VSDLIIAELEGFETLRKKIKTLPDRAKVGKVRQILRRSARPTIQAARDEAPESDAPHLMRGKLIQPGNLKKSIRAAVLRKSKVPLVVVGPRSSGKYDGFYGRQFVIPGTVKQAMNPFMQRAAAKTETKVTAKAKAGMEKYIQKLIDRI
jgi:HK97 gp10 family phage protein